MPRVQCRKCGARRRMTLFDTDVVCEQCGAAGEHLEPVTDEVS